MRIPLFSWLACALVLCAARGAAPGTDYTLEITPQGDNTYALTRWAKTGFDRNVDKLKERARADAADYCAKRHRVLKVVSTTAHRPFVPTTGIAYAKVVFQALDADDPALRAPASPVAVESAAPPPPRTPAAALYDDLTKLEELHRRGILSDQEFQTLKTRLIDKTR